jgi:quinol monooxygenase YgiN
MEAFQAHIAAEHFKQGGAAMKDFVSAPTQVRILKAENVANK